MFKNKVFHFLVVVFTFALLVLSLREAFASHCPGTDYDCQIKEIQQEIDALRPAQEKNEKELVSLRKQLADIKNKITGIGLRMNDLEMPSQERTGE